MPAAAVPGIYYCTRIFDGGRFRRGRGRTTNLGHRMRRNYKIFRCTCVYASRGTCHGMHASGMRISAARGGAAGGSRDIDTERDPQELDTSWQQLAQDSGS